MGRDREPKLLNRWRDDVSFGRFIIPEDSITHVELMADGSLMLGGNVRNCLFTPNMDGYEAALAYYRWRHSNALDAMTLRPNEVEESLQSESI